MKNLSVEDTSHSRLQASPDAVRWFRDARFGMFIHWGVYALLGRGEWVMHTDQIPVEEYEKLPPQFKYEIL
ncbi:MAG: alpha-L-fucosidase [Candidatus Latescibacteria bacterium]|nr:alpha-L-fucosidase [Candidatus Latescibacterota bacterium]